MLFHNALDMNKKKNLTHPTESNTIKRKCIPSMMPNNQKCQSFIPKALDTTSICQLNQYYITLQKSIDKDSNFTLFRQFQKPHTRKQKYKKTQKLKRTQLCEISRGKCIGVVFIIVMNREECSVDLLQLHYVLVPYIVQ